MDDPFGTDSMREKTTISFKMKKQLTNNTHKNITG